jgi:hypothetical protein
MFIVKGKTDWTMIVAVLAIAVASGGGLMLYINDTIAQAHYFWGIDFCRIAKIAIAAIFWRFQNRG